VNLRCDTILICLPYLKYYFLSKIKSILVLYRKKVDVVPCVKTFGIMEHRIKKKIIFKKSYMSYKYNVAVIVISSLFSSIIKSQSLHNSIVFSSLLKKSPCKVFNPSLLAIEIIV